MKKLKKIIIIHKGHFLNLEIGDPDVTQGKLNNKRLPILWFLVW